MKVVVWLLTGLLLLGIAYSFSTCQSNSSQDRVEISMFDWNFAPNIKLARERIEIFEARNPGIKVLLVTGQEEKYQTMIAAKVTPDVGATGYGYLFYYAKCGSILPLDDLIEADEKKREAILALDKIADLVARREGIMALDEDIADDDAKKQAIAEMDQAVVGGKAFSCAEHFDAMQYYSRDDYFPATIESSKYDGKIYALPSTGSPVALIYNKDMFRKYNEDHPDEPLTFPNEDWTWDDYRKAAVALTQRSDDGKRVNVFGAYMGFHRNRFPMFVWQAGGEVISKDKKRCLMDSPEAIRGIQFMYDILWKYECAPTAQTEMEGASAQNDSVLFKEGRIAMLLTARYAYSKLIKDGKYLAKFDWDIAPLPKNPETGIRTSIYIGGGWVISANSLNRDEAWRVAKFLVSAESNDMSARAGRAMPCHIAAAKKATSGPNHKPEHDHLWIDIMNDCRHKDFEYRVGVAAHMFNKGMEEIYELPYDRRSPKEACINCTRFFNKGLKILHEKDKEREKKAGKEAGR